MRISDMSDKKLLAMVNTCSDLSDRDLIDLYLILDRRFHQIPLDDDEFDTFINALDLVDTEIIQRMEKNNEK